MTGRASRPSIEIAIGGAAHSQNSRRWYNSSGGARAQGYAMTRADVALLHRLRATPLA
jgi:hypothetical protein